MLIKSANGHFSGEFLIPGDKSITHRAVMLSAICSKTSTIKRPLLGQDCLDTVRCIQQLGATAKLQGDYLQVTGSAFNDNKTLYCGNSGTTMRLLCGLLSGQNINVTLTGDEHLSRRPMLRVTEPLGIMGANIYAQNGCAPIVIKPSTLTGAQIKMQVASAQIKSAVLLAGLNAQGKTTVIESAPTRNHTELMLKSMGANINIDGQNITISQGSMQPIDITVPGDISSAAYFLVLGALLGQVTVKAVGINPTRCGILTVFDRCNVQYKLENIRFEGFEKVADITVYKSDIMPCQITAEDMPYLIDEIPVIAVLLARAQGTSTISGAQELRVKECDRIQATAQILNVLGAKVAQTTDGLIISGVQEFTGGIIQSYFDHRIAMSGAVGLVASKNGGSILQHECADISFPNFYKMLGRCYE